jgi:hypothetical protein
MKEIVLALLRQNSFAALCEPRARRSLFCPLPLRERAAATFQQPLSGEGVSSQKRSAAPSPNGVCGEALAALSRKGRGQCNSSSSSLHGADRRDRIGRTGLIRENAQLCQLIGELIDRLSVTAFAHENAAIKLRQCR